MASAARPESGSAGRRREILERYVGLQGKEPAAVLGVSRDADPTAVRAAFAALAKRFHPDSLGEESADLREPLQAIFIRITEAYRALQGSKTSKPPRPEFRPATAPLPGKREASPRPVPDPRPAPALDPQTKQARVGGALEAATALLARSDTSAAVSALHEVMGLADETERKRIRTLLARAYVSESKWRRYGVALLDELLREAPGDAEALAILGDLYHREGLLARAEATLRRALASDPGLREARIQHRAVIAALEKRRAAAGESPPERPGLVARLLTFAR